MTWLSLGYPERYVEQAFSRAGIQREESRPLQC
jgi:hypothetical protein